MSDGLIRLVQSLGQPKVLVVGDLMLDRYERGSVSRISPEAPIQVLNVEQQSFRLGGAGSVAHNLAVMGAQVTCCGLLGDDPEAETFIAELDRLDIRHDGVLQIEDRPTTLKTRFIARQQQVLRVDREDASEPLKSVQICAADYAEAVIPEQDAVVIQDYSKGLVTPLVCERIIRKCRQMDIPVLIDPGRGADYSKYRGANCLKPNRTEAANATRLELAGDDAIRRAARALIDELDLDAVMITLDRDGLYMREAGGDELSVPPDALEVFDVTGAGDVTISVLAMVIAAGGGYRDAATIANAAGAVEVTKVGAQPVTCNEIIAQFNRQSYGYARKIVDDSALSRIARDLRERGKAVVFTNGCFDLLHAGHIRLLHDARKLGDMLIVGLNTDASIRLQKAPDRPILPQEERAHVLAAIADVDYVVLFDEETPKRLIEEVVRPDVLVKGSDYEGKLVVGRDFVEAHGGRVELVQIVPGMSTSSIVSKIRDTGK